MVAKIRKEVDAGSFEVYSSVHHQHDSVGADLALTERSALLELAGRVKFDDAKRRGTHLNLATISESFEVEFGGRSRAQQTSWLRTVIKWSKGGPECDGLRRRHGTRSHSRSNGVRIAEMEYTSRKGKKLFDPASLRTKGGRQTLIYDIMPQLRPKPPEDRKRSRRGSGTLTDQSAKRVREDRERGRVRRRISVGNEREMARDEMNVQPKLKKKKKRRETMKFCRPVREDRRGSEATRETKKQEMKKRMAEDRHEAREEAREVKKRRPAAVEAVKAAMKGRRVRHRLLKTSVDRGMNDTDGDVWNDGEVSFLHEAQPGEAAEALDTGGRRERSHSGAKEASEARKSKLKENG